MEIKIIATVKITDNVSDEVQQELCKRIVEAYSKPLSKYDSEILDKFAKVTAVESFSLFNELSALPNLHDIKLPEEAFDGIHETIIETRIPIKKIEHEFTLCGEKAEYIGTRFDNNNIHKFRLNKALYDKLILYNQGKLKTPLLLIDGKIVMASIYTNLIAEGGELPYCELLL